jgi:hypothetical protein
MKHNKSHLGAIERAENAFTAERLEAATIRAAMDDMVRCIGAMEMRLSWIEWSVMMFDYADDVCWKRVDGDT